MCIRDKASSSSYWKLELDDLQRSHIQKILAFGYPQVDYGYSRQVQYAATQVLIWEVVSHSRYNTDIKSCSDYGLYRNVYAVLGADFQSCYDGDVYKRQEVRVVALIGSAFSAAS